MFIKTHLQNTLKSSYTSWSKMRLQNTPEPCDTYLMEAVTGQSVPHQLTFSLVYLKGHVVLV